LMAKAKQVEAKRPAYAIVFFAKIPMDTGAPSLDAILASMPPGAVELFTKPIGLVGDPAPKAKAKKRKSPVKK